MNMKLKEINYILEVEKMRFLIFLYVKKIKKI